MADFDAQEPTSAEQSEAADAVTLAQEPTSTAQPEQGDPAIPAIERSMFGVSGDLISAVWQDDFTIVVQLEAAVAEKKAATLANAYAFTPVDPSDTIGIVITEAVDAPDLGITFKRLTTTLATNGKSYDATFDVKAK